MQNTIVVHVYQMNLLYAFIVSRSILRHLGEFGEIRLTFFGKGGGSSKVSKSEVMADFKFLCKEF